MNGSQLISSTNTMSQITSEDQKDKEFRMEILMEKLRSRTSQYKTLADTSKAVRMTMLDKRWALDSADKGVLQKCLDNLQHCIKVTSLQGLIERLECLSRQLSLKFMVGTSGVDLFISSDMFYLEILLEATGAVKDVKIHHEGKIDQQSCEDLVSCISRGDFADFTIQLEGLISIYQLNAEKKIKCKAFSALQSLETDLVILGQLQAFIKDPIAQVYKSPIGYLQKRRGGHAMRLTYFVSPYELLDKEKGLQPLTTELLNGTTTNGSQKQPIGHYATVLLEGSTGHKLQIAPIISVAQRSMPKSGPVYAPLSMQNSFMLPACFVLRLPRPIALCSGIAQIIRATTEVDCGGDWSNTRPLLGLIARHAFSEYSKGKNVEMDLSRGLFVTLPDQAQCFFLTECKSLLGTLVSAVSFTHPSHVPTLVSCLRQQALFNTLIASCIRPNSKQDLESMIMFEVSALTWQHISISLEHPIEESMATVEIDLSDISAPRVVIYASNSTPASLEPLNEYISRVLQKSHSIPITLRSLVKFWEREAATKHMNGGYSALDNSNFSLGLGAIDPGGPDIKQENGLGGQIGGNRTTMYPSNVNHPHQGSYLSDMQHNLSVMATQECNSQGSTQSAPTMELQPHYKREKKKNKKRKSDDANSWSAKKTKPVFSQVLLESSSSVSENSEISDIEDEVMNSNSSNDDDDDDEQVGSPNSHVGFVSDLELSGLDPSELVGGSSNDQRMSGSDLENSDVELNDLKDVEDMIRSSAFSKSSEHRKKHKSRDSPEGRNKITSTNALLLDLTDSKYMPPSVSITPINSGNVTPTTPSASSTTPPNFSSMLCLDRRPGIEIIPISSTPPTSLPSSITITPITPSQAKSIEDRHRSDRKSSSSSKSSRSSSTERSKDKKKKKKREDPMGPPDKLPPKQDPLTKPVSVSIKPTDGSPLSIRSSSPNSLSRKFSPSPTHGRSVSITKSSSPSSMKAIGKPSGSSSHHSSPRSSPIQSSPKHLSGYSSPKSHGTSSPKHSSSSSGKPSMSTLKSATSGSPSGKSSSGYDLSKISKLSSKDGYSNSSSNREKDRKSNQSGINFFSSGSSSPKLKSSSVKLKQLDLSSSPTIELQTPVTAESLITQGIDINKSTVSNQNRNRKGSLSAVIDKLKSAQYCGNETEVIVTKSSSSGNSNLTKDRSSSSFNKVSDSKSNSSNSSLKLSESKNQEYMVKPSSDGMKITINKTRTKDSNSSSNVSKSSFNASSSTNNSTTKQSSSSPSYQNSSNPSAGSLKTHTGLKPGVISGPASKKPQVMLTSKSSGLLSSNPQNFISSNLSVKTSSAISINNANSPKTSYVKSNSNSSINTSSSKSMSMKSNSSGSPKMSNSSDISKVIRDREREKSRPLKTNSGLSGNDKSIFHSKSSERRSSPAPSKDEIDGERSLKLLNQHTKEPNFVVEGLIKSLDTSKFQIPKLSARNSDDSNKMKSQVNMDKSNFQNVSQHGESRLNQSDNPAKLLDFIGRQEHLNSKYSFQQLTNAKWSESVAKSLPVNMSQSLSKTIINMDSVNPKVSLSSSKISDDMQPANLSFSAMSKHQADYQKENTKGDSKSMETSKLPGIISNLSGKEDFNNPKIDTPLTPTKLYPQISVCSAETINQNLAKQLEAAASKNFGQSLVKSSIEDMRKSLSLNTDLSMKPPLSTGILKSGSTTPQEAAEMLLDFSSSNSKSEHKTKLPSFAERAIPNVPMRRNTPPLSAFPPSPSVSVHIVKSPAPSPLIIPSPHSNSPCITDDELMDEALVGPGK